MKYSNNANDACYDIEEQNLGEEWKLFMVFNNMIADMVNNKGLHPVVTELFIGGRKLNISLVFAMQSYFQVPKNVRLNTIPSLWIFQTDKSFNKSPLIFHLILTSKTSWGFIRKLYR